MYQGSRICYNEIGSPVREGGVVKPQAGMTSCGVPSGKGGCLCLSGTSGSRWGSLAPMDLRLALILLSESHTPRKGLVTTEKVLRHPRKQR